MTTNDEEAAVLTTASDQLRDLAGKVRKGLYLDKGLLSRQKKRIIDLIKV